MGLWGSMMMHDARGKFALGTNLRTVKIQDLVMKRLRKWPHKILNETYEWYGYHDCGDESKNCVGPFVCQCRIHLLCEERKSRGCGVACRIVLSVFDMEGQS